MDQAIVSQWRRPDRHRRLAVLAGSLAFHGLVLTAIGIGLAQGRLTPPGVTDPPPIYLDIAPRPLLKGETARAPASSMPITAPEDRPLRGSTSSPDARLRPDDDQTDRPSPPAPRAAGAPVAGSGSVAVPGGGAWTYRPETQASAMSRAFRTGATGCRDLYDSLNEGERRLCDHRFNAAAVEAARRHPLGPRSRTTSEQRRDAEFAREGAAAIRRYDARRAPLRPGVGVVGPADCVGSNLGTGCAGAHLPDVPSVDMRQGADSLIRQPSNKLD